MREDAHVDDRGISRLVPTVVDLEGNMSASPKTQQEANRRLEQILLYAQGGETTTSLRSIHRWVRAYQAAEEQYGCGYIGLLDRVADCGNRTRRIPDASMQMLETYLKTHYATPQAKRAAAIYRLYRKEVTTKTT